jgi:hypothetical protein
MDPAASGFKPAWHATEYGHPIMSHDETSDTEGISQRGLLSSSARGFARLNGAEGGGGDGLDSDEVALCLGYHAMLD